MEVSVDCAEDTENNKQYITVILRRIEALSAPCKIQFLYLFIEIVLLIFVAMANRLKSRSQSTNPDTLKPEKIEQVTVRDLVKDERTHKIIGTLFLLICLFLFTCFSSYLFTWAEDQSEINRTSLFFPDKEIEIANILGTLGAWVSYQVMNNGFGLASFLICILFLLLVSMQSPEGESLNSGDISGMWLQECCFSASLSPLSAEILYLTGVVTSVR